MDKNKLKDIAGLGDVARTLQAGGKTVVLAHGTFDLMHLGHVRHLEAARKEGDVLIVTVTADPFVNKGPGRPIFSHFMRAEMLGSLECVDYVGVNEAATAENVLETVRPDVYVKGSDYANDDDDVTGGIVSERRAVEKHGGRLVFTNEVTFSSSSLANRHLDIYDPPLREFLDRHRQRNSLEELSRLLEGLKDIRVLMVGDIIIDEYRYVLPMGRSSKENMIATLFQGQELFAGGVIAAANHVADFCREVEVLSCLGEQDSHEELIRASLHANVRLTALPRPDMPTNLKTRFVDQSYLRKLFEVYVMDDTPLANGLETQFIANIREKAAAADIVIVTDFGHGLITPRIIDALIETAPFLAVNAQTNSANTGFNLITKYRKADYICIDSPEARLAVADKHADIVSTVSKLLPERIDCRRIIVTNGRHGCVSYDGDSGHVVQVPAFTRTVIDTVGAGDAFFAVTAPLVAIGVDMERVALVGNAAGALKVNIVGHRKSVEKSSLLKYIQTLLK